MSSRFNVKSNLTRRSLVAGAGLWLAAPAIVKAEGQNGAALVIGNSKYKWEASLPNVRRDIADVAKRLQEIGLKTDLVQDANRATMQAVIEKFKSAAAGADFALFYYAGHGASWDKHTYLVPVDTDLATPDAVKSLQNVSEISDAIKEANKKLLVFDNCRNNPADGWRQKAAADMARVANTEWQMMAGVERSPNTLGIFSTAPGNVALDGAAGENSPFAAALLEQLAASSINLQTLPTDVRRSVLIKTNGQQVVWSEGEINATLVPTRKSTAEAKTISKNYSPTIIEIPKAYAFAAKRKLKLPLGLVCVVTNTEHNNKIGSYSFDNKTWLGAVGSIATSNNVYESILIILGVDSNQAASAIISSVHFQHAGGAYWRLGKGRITDDSLELKERAGMTSDFNRQIFKWGDNKISYHWLGGVSSSPWYSSVQQLDR